MNFLMKLTRNALWWGDGRKGEKLFFSSRITAGGVREEKNISVGAQTNAVHLASTMRRTLIDPGGELTALLALPCQISCGVCPQTCPLTHPSKTPVSQEWGRWGEWDQGILVLFCNEFSCFHLAGVSDWILSLSSTARESLWDTKCVRVCVRMHAQGHARSGVPTRGCVSSVEVPFASNTRPRPQVWWVLTTVYRHLRIY